MYVPTADGKKLQKIPSLKADTLVLDFEDGVAFNQKVSFFRHSFFYNFLTSL